MFFPYKKYNEKKNPFSSLKMISCLFNITNPSELLQSNVVVYTRAIYILQNVVQLALYLLIITNKITNLILL